VKILIAFTGFNDPYAKSVVEGAEKNGPILSLLAVRAFDHVFLLAALGTTALTEETAAAIKGTDVTILCLHLPDPTDYLAILRELRRECATIREQYLDAELFVATLGTPQMHACWFLLTASCELPANAVTRSSAEVRLATLRGAIEQLYVGACISKAVNKRYVRFLIRRQRRPY
jgi:sigma54-dependent transcription regulator